MADADAGNLDEETPDILTTPEGDGEPFVPALPPSVTEASVDSSQSPYGGADPHAEPHGLEEIVDEIGLGALPKPRTGLQGF
jgi:hypothetical protein